MAARPKAAGVGGDWNGHGIAVAVADSGGYTLLQTVIGGFLGDNHVMDVAFAQTCRRNP